MHITNFIKIKLLF